MAALLGSEFTTFSLDNMGRFLCNTLQEAMDSAAQSVAGQDRGFDVIGLQSYANSPVAFRNIQIKL